MGDTNATAEVVSSMQRSGVMFDDTTEVLLKYLFERVKQNEGSPDAALTKLSRALGVHARSDGDWCSTVANDLEIVTTNAWSGLVAWLDRQIELLDAQGDRSALALQAGFRPFASEGTRPAMLQVLAQRLKDGQRLSRSDFDRLLQSSQTHCRQDQRKHKTRRDIKQSTELQGGKFDGAEVPSGVCARATVESIILSMRELAITGGSQSTPHKVYAKKNSKSNGLPHPNF